MQRRLLILVSLGLFAPVTLAGAKNDPPPPIAPDLKASGSTPPANATPAAATPANPPAANGNTAAPAPDLKAGATPDQAAGDGGLAAPAPVTYPDGGVAPVAEPVTKATDEDFDKALNKHFKGDAVGAAAGFYGFIRGSARTADRYEWAEHFLAMDLDKLGFKQAAIRFEVSVAEERARPEVLPDALNHIEDLIGVNPYQPELVEDELLHGSDFGPLPARSRSFVNYYQGLVDYRQGNTKWGDKRFAKIDPDSKYAVKVRYLKAVYRLAHDKDDVGAKADFLAIAKDETAPRDLRNQSKIAVARLDYEQKDFEGSYDMYNSVQLSELDPGRAGIYLERAWNLYRLKKYGDSMGLLFAIDAPSFRDVFLPDKYLLRSLIYKDLCHYLPAKRSAREFGHRYFGTLKNIRARSPLYEDPKLLAAAHQLDDDFGKATELRDSTQKEQELIERYASPWGASGLANELERVYGLLAATAERHFEVARDRGLKRAADRLLVEEEQLRLEDYEVSLDMYKRYKKGKLVADLPKEQDVTPDEVVYDFDGEYWNDELRDYHMFLPTRCLEAEGQ